MPPFRQPTTGEQRRVLTTWKVGELSVTLLEPFKTLRHTNSVTATNNIGNSTPRTRYWDLAPRVRHSGRTWIAPGVRPMSPRWIRSTCLYIGLTLAMLCQTTSSSAFRASFVTRPLRAICPCTGSAPARQRNIGRPRKLLYRDTKHPPISVKELALSCLPKRGRR